MRYSGEPLPPVKSFDQTGHTIFVNSFSKIFSPGSRLGYICAKEEIIRRIYDVKTATNSHASVMAQVICAEFFNRGLYEPHIKMIRDIHRERRDMMMDCIKTLLPAEIKSVYPDGGLFTWVELPQRVNTTALLADAHAQKVAYVPGREFFVEDKDVHDNCMRISFGGVEPEKIRIGMERLAGVIKAKL
jgi:2-aminoadipate transaminase